MLLKQKGIDRISVKEIMKRRQEKIHQNAAYFQIHSLEISLFCRELKLLENKNTCKKTNKMQKKFIKWMVTHSYLPKSDESRKPLANGFESIFNLVIN